jgi:3-oxoacyl-[acyl-carrier-protein] synthase-3
MKAYIKAISYYLPDKVLSNEDLSDEFPDWSAEKISSKIGISWRHISAQDEYSSDMAITVANKLFEEHQIPRSSIDFVLLCTQSPDYFLPTTACIVQHSLGIPVSAGALDFNLGCSGYIYGLSLAKGLIFAGIAKNILLITSETYTKFIHPDDKSNRAIFGDGAAATLISLDGFGEICDFSLGTDGSGASNLIVKYGGLRHSYLKGIAEDKRDSYLYMEGSEIFNFTIASVPELVRNTLEKNNLKIEDINKFIFHQANRFMLNHLRKKIGIEEAAFLYYMESCANTVSSTIPIVLYEAAKAKTINNNDLVLLAGFGVGYSWGGTVLRVN